MAKRHTVLTRLTAEMERDLDRSMARAKAREAAEDEAMTGQAIVSIERYDGAIRSVTLANGWTLRARSNDSESWIDAED